MAKGTASAKRGEPLSHKPRWLTDYPESVKAHLLDDVVKACRRRCDGAVEMDNNEEWKGLLQIRNGVVQATAIYGAKYPRFKMGTLVK